MANEIGYQPEQQIEKPNELTPQEIAAEQQKPEVNQEPTIDASVQSQEQSATTQNSQESINPEAPQIEMRVRPQDQFAAHVDEYGKLKPAVLKYIIETKHSDLVKENHNGNPFLAISSEESAALLLAIDGSTTQNPRNPTQKDPLTEELRDRVLLDTNSAQLYFPERMKQLTPEELILEITTLADTIKRGENVSLIYLQSVNAAKDSQQAEIDQLITVNLDAQEALFVLEDEMERPEYKVAAITQATNNVVADDENLGNAQALADLSPDSQVIGTERTSEGELTVTFQEKNSSELKKVIVKEENIWQLALLAASSDVLLGGNNLSRLGEVWAKYHVISPILTQMGLDTTEFMDIFGQNKFDAFDRHLKIMDDRTCEIFFDDITRNRVLFDTLQNCRPEHLQKIFHPDGPQPFGDSGLLGYDHLKLSPELVKKMWNALNEQQRIQLRLPQPTPQAVQ